VSLYEQLALDRERARHARLKEEQRRLELLRLGASLAALRVELAFIKPERALLRKYRPDQPRMPAGNPRAGSGRGSAAVQGRASLPIVSWLPRATASVASSAKLRPC
jgi:hypothetical protein